MLCEIIRVMEVDDALFMRLHDIIRQKETLCDILADFPRHIVALYAVYGRVFVGVFLFYFFVAAF